MNRRAQRGLTMVELMVAITIGLILTAGIIQVFVSSKNTYRVDSSLARAQESGRMALDAIANDIRMAGFGGCQSTNLINDLTPGAINFNVAITGTEGGAAPDSITLRGGDSTPGVALQPNAAGGILFIQSTSAAPRVTSNAFNTNDIVLVSDCSGGDFFQVTGTAADALGGFDINHANGGGPPGNSTGAFSHVYQGDANMFYAREIIYTIKAGSDGQNALWRSVNSNGTAQDQEIVDDVTDLQILYGEDMDGDRSVDRYVTAANVANFGNVDSVRIQVKVQTADANTSVQAATRITHTFSAVVVMRNRVL